MGLEKVKQEILESAVKKAESITGAASSEAKEIARAVDKRLDEYGRLIEDEIEKAADALKRRELAATELEVRKGMLAAKSRAIEAVFSDARKRIGQLSDKRRESHVRALLDSARSELAVAVVICNPKDADVVGTFGKVLAAVIFFVFAVIFFYLPGLAILKKTNLSDGEKYILSWPVGITVFTLFAFIFGYLHFYWGLLVLPVASLILIRKGFIKPPFGEFSLWTKIIILLGSLSWLLTTVKNGLLYDYGLGFWGAHGHDAIVHLSLIESIKSGLPLENFSFAGQPLVNYHYFYDLLLGVTSTLTRIEPVDLYFRAFPVLISISLGLVCFTLAKNWFKPA